MKKYYMLLSKNIDGEYVFGLDFKSYANCFKICEYNNKDVVIVVSDDDEYLRSCSEFMSDNSFEFSIKFNTAAQRSAKYLVENVLYSYDEWVNINKPSCSIINPVLLFNNNIDGE